MSCEDATNLNEQQARSLLHSPKPNERFITHRKPAFNLKSSNNTATALTAATNEPPLDNRRRSARLAEKASARKF